MPQQGKLDCPIYNHPRLTNLSDHLVRSHNISGKEKKALLRRARFLVLSRRPEQPHPSVPRLDSTPGRYGYTVPETSSLPEHRQLPNPTPLNSTSDENEDELILCPYDSRISYERVWAPMFLLWTMISSNCIIPLVC